MILLKYVSIVVSLIAHGVTAYPQGAPASSCATMTPEHGFQAQTSLSPFVTLSLVITSHKLRLELCIFVNILIFIA